MDILAGMQRLYSDRTARGDWPNNPKASQDFKRVKGKKKEATGISSQSTVSKSVQSMIPSGLS